MAVYTSLLSSGCSGSAPEEPTALAPLPYQLSHPQAVYQLEPELLELSGLAWAGNVTLAATNDEEGTVYFLSATTGKVQRTLEWGPAGDYEGLALNPKRLYVVESSGTVSALSNWQHSLSVENFKAVLPHQTELEGAALASTQLKNDTGSVLYVLEKSSECETVGLWRITFTTDGTPKARLQFSISEAEVSPYVLPGSFDRFLYRALRAIGVRSRRVVQPSAVAIHPSTHNFYILSAASGYLLVYNSEGKLKHINLLPASLFPQAEAITFDSAATLYVGNEGSGTSQPATLLKFLYDER